jgi:hypothetical protein
VAVNGRVAATTVSFADGDTRRFAAIVSTRAFARGQNTVEVLAVPADGGRTAQLRGSTGGYRLVRAGGRAAIADSSGRRFPVVPAAVAGAVEDLSIAGADVRVSGWAGSTDPPRAADRVLLFVAGRFASATRPALPRPDLERRHGRGLARAGFELGGGIQGGAGADRSDVRVFALSGGRASELPAPRGP